MCLIVFALGVHPRYPLVVLANRDEAYARPTTPAAFWKDSPSVFAGRDGVHGGTWLGVTTRGRFAALTNVRDRAARREGRSRGLAVAGLLTTDAPLDRALDALHRQSATFPAFNMIAGDASGVFYLGDHAAPESIVLGVHGLSNHRLDSSWPKVERAKERLAERMQAAELDREALFAIMSERSPAPDDRLPSTGVPVELERVLSSAFIVAHGYGTRSSTLILFQASGAIDFEERSFGEGGSLLGSVSQVLVRASYPCVERSRGTW